MRGAGEAQPLMVCWTQFAFPLPSPPALLRGAAPGKCIPARYSQSACYRWPAAPRKGSDLPLRGVSCSGCPSACTWAVGRSEIPLRGKVPAVHLRFWCADRHQLDPHLPFRAGGTVSNPTTASIARSALNSTLPAVRNYTSAAPARCRSSQPTFAVSEHQPASSRS